MKIQVVAHPIYPWAIRVPDIAAVLVFPPDRRIVRCLPIARCGPGRVFFGGCTRGGWIWDLGPGSRVYVWGRRIRGCCLPPWPGVGILIGVV